MADTRKAKYKSSRKLQTMDSRSHALDEGAQATCALLEQLQEIDDFRVLGSVEVEVSVEVI